jgi:leader peptidase (prepilin peptidase)/N-methyltransferase
VSTLWLEAVFVFLVGACVGSFLNVVIIRLPRGRSLVAPSSRCGFCRSALVWWTNLPIIGFLIAKGQCMKCGVPYSARYAVIEFVVACLALSVWSMHGWTWISVGAFIFVSLLVAISFIDIDLKLIPDTLSIGGMFFFLALSVVAPHWMWVSWDQALLGAMVGFGSFWALSRLYYILRHEEGLGGGDVKLMGLVGAYAGLQGVVTTTLIGSLLGAGVGLVLVLVRGKSKHFPIPFGPFLAMGALVATFQLDGWLWK